MQSATIDLYTKYPLQRGGPRQCGYEVWEFDLHFYTWPVLGIGPLTFWFWVQHPIHLGMVPTFSIGSDIPLLKGNKTPDEKLDTHIVDSQPGDHKWQLWYFSGVSVGMYGLRESLYHPQDPIRWFELSLNLYKHTIYTTNLGLIYFLRSFIFHTPNIIFTSYDLYAPPHNT